VPAGWDRIAMRRNLRPFGKVQEITIKRNDNRIDGQQQLVVAGVPPAPPTAATDAQSP
jgi:hypothetical protein